MAMSKRQVIAEVNRLSRLCKDSERGFNVAAENIDNRGLKTLLKTYAQQRAHFAEELQEQVRLLGSKPTEGGSFLAVIHRGWIDIKNAMTIGQESTENVVLDECRRGERVAVRRYERALQQEWPPQIRDIVERQLESIRIVRERIRLLRGAEHDRMVVRLYDRNELVEQAKQALERAGFNSENLESVELREVAGKYSDGGERSAVFESIVTGALIGVVVGGALGLVAAIGARIVGAMDPGASLSAWQMVLTTTITGSVIGAFLIGLIGALIGVGIREGDTHLYADSIEHGHTLLMVRADNHARASEASSIMYQINVADRATPQTA